MAVLVTRPEPEAGDTAARLAARGHEAIVAPVLRAEPLPIPSDLGRFGAVVVTSARTLSFLPAGVIKGLAGISAFAVGDRTAEAMRRAGFRQVRSADGDVAALAALIAAAGLPKDTPLVHLGGEERAGDLEALLAPAGLQVTTIPLYRMVPAESLPAAATEALAHHRVTAVLHYSPRSAMTFLALATGAGLTEAAARCRHICLSEAVAAPLRPAFGATVEVAVRPNEASLFDVLGR
jgi:uroporphyrinogen-III synthase